MEREYSELKQELLLKFDDAQKLNDKRFYFLCLTGLETGARVSDLLKLSWSSYDLQNNILSYHNTKSGKNQRAKFSDALKARYATYKDMVMQYNTDIEKVFYNPKKGVVMSRVSATRRTKSEFGFGFHEFRHTSAKHVASKKGLVNAKNHLGHSRATTTDNYLKLSENMHLESMEDII